MSRCLMMLGLAVLFTATYVWAEEVAAPTAEQKERVAAVLTALKAGDDAGRADAEQALSNDGNTLAPALIEALHAHTGALAKGDGDEALTRARIDVLDGALIRLNWGWDPRKLVVEWAARFRDADGAPFVLKIRPVRIIEPVTDRVFPAHLFFTLRFPAGVVPPDGVNAQNLIVVQKSGTLKVLPDTKSLEGIFTTALMPVQEDDEQGVKDIVCAWLRLSGEFGQDGKCRFTIPEDSIKASYRKSVVSSVNGWRGTGKAMADPKSGIEGEINIALAFDDSGKVKSISETRELAPVTVAAPATEPAPKTPEPPAATATTAEAVK